MCRRLRCPLPCAPWPWLQFKEISQAYEVLSDAEKREIYDQYGEEALKEGAGGGHDPFDLFSSFFGTGGHPFGGSFGRECPALASPLASAL